MDFLDGVKSLSNGSVELAILDPPYFEIKGEFDFVFDSEKTYLQFIENCIQEVERVLKPNGSLYIYCSQQMGAHIDILIQKYLKIKNRIIWYRSGCLSPTKKFKLSHEPLFYCVKDINNHIWNPNEIRVKSKYADKDKRLNPLGKVPDDVWEIPNLVGKKSEKVDHPTQKPLELMEDIIKIHTNENDIVFDPFGGSFTTARACKNLNRQYISCDIDSEYVQKGKERLAVVN